MAAAVAKYCIFIWGTLRREATEDPLEATEVSSRAQILARRRDSTPLPTPPGPLKLRLFQERLALGGEDKKARP